MIFDLTNYFVTRARQTKSLWKFTKNNQNLNFTTYRIWPFWVVDFCLRGSADYNFYIIKNPFDYIDKGDDKLHADSEIAQFWLIFINLELSKHEKRVFVNPAKMKLGISWLFLIWSIYMSNIFISIWLQILLRCWTSCWYLQISPRIFIEGATALQRGVRIRIA